MYIELRENMEEHSSCLGCVPVVECFFFSLSFFLNNVLIGAVFCIFVGGEILHGVVLRLRFFFSGAPLYLREPFRAVGLCGRRSPVLGHRPKRAPGT
jgi:hypothetical protein